MTYMLFIGVRLHYHENDFFGPGLYDSAPQGGEPQRKSAVNTDTCVRGGGGEHPVFFSNGSYVTSGTTIFNKGTFWELFFCSVARGRSRAISPPLFLVRP